MKKLLIIFFIFTLFFNTATASEWKKIKDENIKNLKLEVWLNSFYYKRNGDYVIYRVRFKNNEIGDYENMVCTNCSDYTSAILNTQLFDKTYIPTFPDVSEVNTNLVEIDKTSMLMSVIPIICNASNYPETKPYNYTDQITSQIDTPKPIKVKKEKKVKEKTYRSSSIGDGFKSFMKGVGTVLGCILIAPLAIVYVVLQALAGA